MAQFNPPSFARPREYGDIPRSIDAVFEAYQKRKDEERNQRIQGLTLASQGIDPASLEGPGADALYNAHVQDFIAQKKKSREGAAAQSAAELEKTKKETAEIGTPKSVDALLAQRVLKNEITLEEAIKMKSSSTPGANPKAPTGFRFTKTGDLEKIPGGPADIKQEGVDEKKDAAKNAMIEQANRLGSTIDSALSKIGVTTAGIGGQVLSQIGGTEAYDLKTDLETIASNLGFAELQAMRQSSPTGGALGAISERELSALQSTVASLKQKQSPEQLRKNLMAIKQHYQKWSDAVSGKTGTESAPATAKKSPEARFAELEAQGIPEAEIYKRMAAEGH